MEHTEISENLFVVRDGAPLDNSAISRLQKLSAGADEELSDMINESARSACPKALYAVSGVEVSGDIVKVSGVFVRSTLMKRNFGGISRAFPYVITAGRELDEWAEKYDGDPFGQYLADEIKKAYLFAFSVKFKEMIRQRYSISSRLSSMNPGSLEKAWPLSGQKELFMMLGGEESVLKNIGVTLKESYLMVPQKSGSGILFETETDYENCKYCPRTDCPHRRAAFVGVKK